MSTSGLNSMFWSRSCPLLLPWPGLSGFARRGKPDGIRIQILIAFVDLRQIPVYPSLRGPIGRVMSGIGLARLVREIGLRSALGVGSCR